jgi:hypothetical protein
VHAPATVRVKLSSEAAGAISLTPVVVQEMPFDELIAFLVPSTGKDAGRVRDALLRGSLVNSASRLRWDSLDVNTGSLEIALARYPDPDPSLPFLAANCLQVTLTGASGRIELPREPCSRRRLLRRQSFWDVLMESAANLRPGYLDYSYREKADIYHAAMDTPTATAIRRAASLLTYSTLVQRLQMFSFDAAEFATRRRT